jgi:hypothetical protein
VGITARSSEDEQQEQAAPPLPKKDNEGYASKAAFEAEDSEAVPPPSLASKKEDMSKSQKLNPLAPVKTATLVLSIEEGRGKTVGREKKAQLSRASLAAKAKTAVEIPETDAVSCSRCLTEHRLTNPQDDEGLQVNEKARMEPPSAREGPGLSSNLEGKLLFDPGVKKAATSKKTTAAANVKAAAALSKEAAKEMHPVSKRSDGKDKEIVEPVEVQKTAEMQGQGKSRGAVRKRGKTLEGLKTNQAAGQEVEESEALELSQASEDTDQVEEQRQHDKLVRFPVTAGL